jgi:hypothetical protein
VVILSLNIVHSAEQIDEPDEVLVVKKALTEHLDMDPKVTLGVLCDQIVPPDEGVDEEEKQIRDRLRELVLSFLSGEAKRTVIRHAVAGSPSEELLLSSLLTVSGTDTFQQWSYF